MRSFSDLCKHWCLSPHTCSQFYSCHGCLVQGQRRVRTHVNEECPTPTETLMSLLTLILNLIQVMMSGQRQAHTCWKHYERSHCIHTHRPCAHIIVALALWCFLFHLRFNWASTVRMQCTITILFWNNNSFLFFGWIIYQMFKKIKNKKQKNSSSPHLRNIKPQKKPS